jgi:oligogalacturonide lyase
VSDVGPTVNLWRWNGTDYGAARALCSHDSSFRIQQVHAHPRLNRAANQVIFCSDVSGHGQIYVADVGDFEGLRMTRDVVGAE